MQYCMHMFGRLECTRSESACSEMSSAAVNAQVQKHIPFPDLKLRCFIFTCFRRFECTRSESACSEMGSAALNAQVQKHISFPALKLCSIVCTCPAALNAHDRESFEAHLVSCFQASQYCD